MPASDAAAHPTVVVLVVPAGTHRPDGLADAVRRCDPTARVVAVWCGDPQRRPVAGVDWLRAAEPSELDLVRRTAGDIEVAAARRATQLLGSDTDVVILTVGDVAVLGSVTSAVPVSGFDPEQPWVLDPAADPGDTVDTDVLAAATQQVVGRRSPVVLPGGWPVDDALRAAVDADPGAPTRPFSEPGAFRAWAEQHYWMSLRRHRADLAAAFAHPGDDDAFARWTNDACRVDDVPLVLGPLPAIARRRPPHTAGSLGPGAAGGINVVGYLDREASLGDVARRLLRCARAADVDTTAVASQRTNSPRLADPPRIDADPRFATSIAVVNADQFAGLRHDIPGLWGPGRRVIGYWFWELETVAPAMRPAFRDVDEIWAGSTFVADAFRTATDRPVHVVPLPVPQPVVATRRRADFEVLADAGDRTVFLVVFDHLSVTERKNPYGAVEAFRRAFRPDEGPLLVVKSMNAHRAWADHVRLLSAAADRPDIRVVDAHLDRPDQMALVAASDVLVSLHRSEGLGLHLAEAMWVGTATIATRYSGNLDFQDDDCAVLVDAGRTPVRLGRGVYPEDAWWADPDLEQAAAAMRRLADDPAYRTRLADAAQRRMSAQPGEAATGERIAELVGVRPSTVTGRP